MKKILFSALCAALIGAAAFAEPDSGAFIPSESFTASHIYLEANGGIVFPAYVFDESENVTKISGGFGVGAGYNWGGWLLGLEYTRDYFGDKHIDKLRTNAFQLRLRRVLSQNTLDFLPRWLEIVPGISGGINVWTAGSGNGKIGFGDEVAPFFRPSLELAFVPNTERAVPYLAFDYNFFTSDKFDGFVAYPRAIVGFRLYPFGGKSAAGAVAAATVAAALTPATGFTPDGDGVNDTVEIKNSLKNLKGTPESWKVEVLDQQNEVLKTWTGTGSLKKITWDGKTDNGDALFSSETYKVRTTVVPSAAERARLGQDTVTDTTTLKTGVLMEEIVPQKQWKIVVNTIYFDANAATFNTLTEEQSTANTETLDSIARQALALSDDIKIEIQGYANNVSNTEEENQKELIPLSTDRADAIKKQLKNRGLKDENLTAVGKGGANPLAAWEDRAHWWKNRRVEFIVTK